MGFKLQGKPWLLDSAISTVNTRANMADSMWHETSLRNFSKPWATWRQLIGQSSDSLANEGSGPLPLGLAHSPVLSFMGL